MALQVKDLALKQLKLRSLLWRGNFHMPWVQPERKKEREKAIYLLEWGAGGGFEGERRDEKNKHTMY